MVVKNFLKICTFTGYNFEQIKSLEDQFYYILLDVDIMDRKFLITQLDE